MIAHIARNDAAGNPIVGEAMAMAMPPRPSSHAQQAAAAANSSTSTRLRCVVGDAIRARYIGAGLMVCILMLVIPRGPQGRTRNPGLRARCSWIPGVRL